MSRHKFPASIMYKVFEVLVSNGCVMKEVDLFESLYEDFNISYSEFLKILLILELRGLIKVSTAKEGIRYVSISEISREQFELKEECPE